MIRTEIVEKIKSHILYLITFFPKWCLLRDNVKRSGTAGQNTDDYTMQIFVFLGYYAEYVVGSKSFRPDVQKPRQMENAVRDI